MTDDESKELCLALMQADSEDRVIALLDGAGLWADEAVWRRLGDNESNYSTVGNQQSRAEAALVEKLINSIDARLVNGCLAAGVDPEGPEAPTTIREGVARFFEEPTKEIRFNAGRIRDWPTTKRTSEGRLITLAATGFTPPGAPSLSIADQGEGQTPSEFPDTFCSLTRGNKLKIPFVQGKFNMGGTGALQFCGRRNLQLILSRRNPALLPPGAPAEASMWGFTLVRREDPASGLRSSVYTYLAPLDAAACPRQGGVIRFTAAEMPIFPEISDGGRVKAAYARPSPYGSLLKLYEYQTQSTRSNIVFSRQGLLRQLDLLLPEVALPIRVYECRDYKGGPASFETNVNGLAVRLEDDKADNLEATFPSSATIDVDGQEMEVTIYAFAKDDSKKDRAKDYRLQQGIVFTINGQAHGNLTVDFFRRKRVGMSYLADSLLLIVDCDRIEPRAREDLFMNSRDRIRKNDLERKIEDALEDLLRQHQGLVDLRNRRRQEEVAQRLQDTKPLQDVLGKIIRDNEALRHILLEGTQVPNPFAPRSVSAADKFVGKPHPSFFRFARKPYGHILQRSAPTNRRPRIQLETDVENTYFSRDLIRGEDHLEVQTDQGWAKALNWTLNLHDGVATLNPSVPESAVPGDTIRYRLTVSDDTLIEPFINEVELTVTEAVEDPGTRPVGPRSRPAGTNAGTDRETAAALALPEPNAVREDEWGDKDPPFDKYTALRVIHAGDKDGVDLYDFQVNIDNVYLRTEQKRSKEPPELLERRFVCALVLIGLGVLQEGRRLEELAPEADEEESAVRPEQKVDEFTRAVAPLLLPMIDGLGAITLDDFDTSTGDASGE
jgi:hypothetical protein